MQFDSERQMCHFSKYQLVFYNINIVCKDSGDIEIDGLHQFNISNSVLNRWQMMFIS